MIASGPDGDLSGCQSNLPALSSPGFLLAVGFRWRAGFASASIIEWLLLNNRTAPVNNTPVATRRVELMKAPNHPTLFKSPASVEDEPRVNAPASWLSTAGH